MRQRRFFVLFGFLALFVLMTSGTAAAHGGTGLPKISNQRAGPYQLFVWADPDPVSVGSYHVTVALTEPQEEGVVDLDSKPILDAAIQVRLERLDKQAAVVTAMAIHGNSANRLLYEADMEFPEPGTWQVALAIDGPQGSADADYTVEVIPDSVNWLLVGGGVLALVVLGGLGFFLFQRTNAA